MFRMNMSICSRNNQNRPMLVGQKSECQAAPSQSSPVSARQSHYPLVVLTGRISFFQPGSCLGIFVCSARTKIKRPLPFESHEVQINTENGVLPECKMVLTQLCSTPRYTPPRTKMCEFANGHRDRPSRGYYATKNVVSIA